MSEDSIFIMGFEYHLLSSRRTFKLVIFYVRKFLRGEKNPANAATGTHQIVRNGRLDHILFNF